MNGIGNTANLINPKKRNINMKKFNVDDTNEFLDALLALRSYREQASILRNCLTDILDHPWVDDEVKNALMENIARQYQIPYDSEG